MKTLIIIVVALVLGTLLAVFSIDDPGVVVLARAPFRVELPLWLFAAILAASFAVLYLLFNFLFDFFATPKKLKKWNASRRNQRAQADTLRGYAKLIEGDWQKGEKQLTGRIGNSKTPLLNFLGAAYAAQQQNNYEKRDQYLQQAEDIDPSHRMAVDLTRARLLAQAGQTDEAKTLLETMHPLAPGNKTILRLMADVYRQSGDLPALSKILPKLQRTKALPAEQCSELDVMCRVEADRLAPVQLSDQSGGQGSTEIVGISKTSKQWIKEWKSLPAARKQVPAMAAMYAEKLIAANELGAAEVVLRTALKKKWNSDLVALYGATRHKNVRQQISFATTWLSNHEDDANVSLTLARLYMALGDTVKAQEFYHDAITLGASDEAFYELGQYFEDQGDRKAALALYKKGIQASISVGSSAVGTGLGLDSPTAEPLELDSVITLGAGSGVGAGHPVPTVIEDAIEVVSEDVKDTSKDDANETALVESK